jgi:hypothetical protein
MSGGPIRAARHIRHEIASASMTPRVSIAQISDLDRDQRS